MQMQSSAPFFIINKTLFPTKYLSFKKIIEIECNITYLLFDTVFFGRSHNLFFYAIFSPNPPLRFAAADILEWLFAHPKKTLNYYLVYGVQKRVAEKLYEIKKSQNNSRTSSVMGLAEYAFWKRPLLSDSQFLSTKLQLDFIKEAIHTQSGWSQTFYSTHIGNKTTERYKHKKEGETSWW